jgi:hypothetical protein
MHPTHEPTERESNANRRVGLVLDQLPHCRFKGVGRLSGGRARGVGNVGGLPSRLSHGAIEALLRLVRHDKVTLFSNALPPDTVLTSG